MAEVVSRRHMLGASVVPPLAIPCVQATVHVHVARHLPVEGLALPEGLVVDGQLPRLQLVDLSRGQEREP